MVWLLLGSLLLVQFAYPLSEHGGVWVGIYLLAYTGVLVFAASAVRVAARRHWPFGVLSLVFVAGGGVVPA